MVRRGGHPPAFVEKSWSVNLLKGSERKRFLPTARRSLAPSLPHTAVIEDELVQCVVPDLVSVAIAWAGASPISWDSLGRVDSRDNLDPAGATLPRPFQLPGELAGEPP